MGEQGSKHHCPEVPKLIPGDTFNTKARRFDRSEVIISLQMVSELGRGAFGVVTKMLVKEDAQPTQRLVAVKIPGGDGSLAEIELYLLLKIKHRNVVELIYYFNGVEGRENMIQIVLELVEGGDLFHYMKKHYSKTRGIGVMFEFFSYQLMRGLAFCHTVNVCHRDIKPENLLVDAGTGVLKIADFGCGCELISPEETHTFYIGTRIFRAPELLLGALKYTNRVDVWSAGVVMSEVALGLPVFYGSKSPKGHLLNIFEYLGVPTDKDFDDMRVPKIPLPPDVEHKSMGERLQMQPGVRNSDLLLDLLMHCFVFSPQQRLSAWEACAHDFFNGLQGFAQLPNGNPAPPLYDFSQHELDSMPEHVRKRLEPLMKN